MLMMSSQKDEKWIKEKFKKLLSPKRFRDTSLNENDYEYNHPFESDYFRIVTSAPFRRLQDKTQIFPLEKNDFIRRRLTHSLEVSAYAEQIGYVVEQMLIDRDLSWANFDYIKHHDIPAILRVAGLVHDIGNPPYGHFGEQTIQKYFRELESVRPSSMTLSLCQYQQKSTQENNQIKSTAQQNALILLMDRRIEKIKSVAEAFSKLGEEQKEDLKNFDGNVHGFRVLRHLGLSADGNSFNLTMPTLATIIKYPYSSTEGNKPKTRHIRSKFGYYDSEKESYERICECLGLAQHRRHPLAYILESADDIANVTSDVEDGFKMGIISCRDIFEQIQDQDEYPDYSYDNIKQYLEALSKSGSSQKNGPEVTDEMVIKELRFRAVHQLINDAAKSFVDNIDDIVGEACGSGQIDHDQSCQDLLDGNPLREILSDLQGRTYTAQSVLKSELQGERVLSTLLDVFLSAMFDFPKECVAPDKKTREGKIYELISKNYRRAVLKSGERFPQDAYRRFLLVIDFIAGMTDSYAYDYYNELMAHHI